MGLYIGNELGQKMLVVVHTVLQNNGLKELKCLT